MHLDRDRIFNEYRKQLLKESPDNIQIGQRNFQYYNTSLGNYTGLLNLDGYYVMTADVQGHGELIYNAKHGITLIHNLESNDDAIRFVRNSNTMEYRIWPKFDVFSMWVDYDPRLIPTVLSIIQKIEKDPEAFVFDFGREGAFSDIDDGMRYDEFVSGELTGDHIQKEEERNARIRQDKKMMADYKLGNLPQKQTSGFSYRRDGD